MFVKLLTAVFVLAAATMLFAGKRPTILRSRAAPPRVPRADDLVVCRGCGVWLPAGTACDCAGAAARAHG